MKKRIVSAALSLALCASFSLPAAALEVEDARTLLRDYYITDLPAAALEASTLEELFSALNDPYTLYYTAEEYAEFLSDVNGETLVGIGVSLHSAFDKGFELMSTLPDSPAMEAGLKAGDKIIAVDGVPLTAQDNITALLTGEEGSEVTVTVRRGEKVLDFTLSRRTVQIPIVTYEKRGPMGYFDCSSFGGSTADDVSIPLWTMDEHTTVWVMDLRSNPGGIADSAAMTATQFLGGNIMVYFRDGQDSYYITRTNPQLNQDLTEKPLIILTSESSASAAELFAGAIRDYGAGIAIGRRTFGKGIAQIIVDETVEPQLFQGDALKITAYQFFSPNGMTCHLTGVLPTLMVTEEYAYAVAELLSSPAPVTTQGWLKLELAGQTFYLDPQDCHDAPDAFTRLLEALPATAQLYMGKDTRQWNPITAQELAEKKGLDYQKRTFSDLEGCEQREAIETLALYELLSGDGTGKFLPDKTLTRGELCAILTSAFQLPVNEDATGFGDVSSDAWYAPAVAAMTARGFLSGTDQGTFEPELVLTNQEFYTVLSAVAEWACMDGHDLAQQNVTAPQWLEYHAYPEWAHEYIRNLDKLGVHVDKVTPTAPVTRAQCAQTLYELMDAMGMFWY